MNRQGGSEIDVSVGRAAAVKGGDDHSVRSARNRRGHAHDAANLEGQDVGGGTVDPEAEVGLGHDLQMGGVGVVAEHAESSVTPPAPGGDLFSGSAAVREVRVGRPVDRGPDFVEIDALQGSNRSNPGAKVGAARDASGLQVVDREITGRSPVGDRSGREDVGVSLQDLGVVSVSAQLVEAGRITGKAAEGNGRDRSRSVGLEARHRKVIGVEKAHSVGRGGGKNEVFDAVGLQARVQAGDAGEVRDFGAGINSFEGAFKLDHAGLAGLGLNEDDGLVAFQRGCPFPGKLQRGTRRKGRRENECQGTGERDGGRFHGLVRDEVGGDHAGDFTSLGEVDDEVLVARSARDRESVADPHRGRLMGLPDFVFGRELEVGIERSRGDCGVQGKGRGIPGEGALIRDKKVGCPGVFKALEEEKGIVDDRRLGEGIGIVSDAVNQRRDLDQVGPGLGKAL